jgi:hypothetical protein
MHQKPLHYVVCSNRKELAVGKLPYPLVLVLGWLLVSGFNAQHPILDKVANKVIQKYQQSSCEQLWQKKGEKTPPAAEEQKVIGFLKSDPQMRTEFINKIAAPIANKMFECGMIP